MGAIKRITILKKKKLTYNILQGMDVKFAGGRRMMKRIHYLILVSVMDQ